jgi:hypothetical protein
MTTDDRDLWEEHADWWQSGFTDGIGRIRPYLRKDSRIEEVQKEFFSPLIHRPMSVYVNARIRNGLRLKRMGEPASFVARAPEYTDAAQISRLLFLRAEKLTRSG